MQGQMHAVWRKIRNHAAPGGGFHGILTLHIPAFPRILMDILKPPRKGANVMLKSIYLQQVYSDLIAVGTGRGLHEIVKPDEQDAAVFQDTDLHGALIFDRTCNCFTKTFPCAAMIHINRIPCLIIGDDLDLSVQNNSCLFGRFPNIQYNLSGRKRLDRSIQTLQHIVIFIFRNTVKKRNMS